MTFSPWFPSWTWPSHSPNSAQQLSAILRLVEGAPRRSWRKGWCHPRTPGPAMCRPGYWPLLMQTRGWQTGGPAASLKQKPHVQLQIFHRYPPQEIEFPSIQLYQECTAVVLKSSDSLLSTDRYNGIHNNKRKWSTSCMLSAIINHPKLGVYSISMLISMIISML